MSKAITISAAHTDFIVFADHFAMSAVKHLARGSPIAPRCYCGLDSELASSLPDPNGVRCIQRWALAIEDTPKMSGLARLDSWPADICASSSRTVTTLIHRNRKKWI